MFFKQEMDAFAASPSSDSPSRRPRRAQRVLADGWGAQVTGSVFCADSSLRFIYESGHGGAPASLSSLAAKGGGACSSSSSSGSAMAHAHAFGTGKRPRENSLEPPTPTLEGVDLHEAEVARACAAISRQAPALPPSFRECAVCLSTNAYAQIGACAHTFHPKCFLRWFRTHRSCPLCRGPVDKVALAPVLSVQDELEAIMSEIDDGPSGSRGAPEGVDVGSGLMDAMMDVDDDPLLSHHDPIMSFLETDCFDADMELVPLDELPPSATAAGNSSSSGMAGFDAVAALEDERMEDDADAPLVPQEEQQQLHYQQHHQEQQQSQQAVGFLMPPMQFAPSSAVPNYWNVLNQGLSAAPAIAPPPPAVANPRVVHIAPKPDALAAPALAPPPPYQQYQQQYLASMKAAAPSPHASHALGRLGTASSRPTEPVKRELAAAAPKDPPVKPELASEAPVPPPRVVSCRCTGGCRNGRCACVKEGGMCGPACRCTSCKNPFLMVKAAGADIDALLQDDCFMHNVSKTRDMVARLQEPVGVPCCHATIKVVDCVQGYVCAPCGGRAYDFSWCMNKLLDHERTPRNHCAICKRCCDHRDVHCHDCGRCYFAGVTASLPCPCKEASHRRRERREHGASAGGNGAGVGASSPSADDDGSDEGDGECSIM